MTKYEIMFIVKANLDETALDNTTKEIQKIILFFWQKITQWIWMLLLGDTVGLL